MASHKVYGSIVKAVKRGKLREPFSKEDFRRACPDLGDGTYNAFLWKHRKGNPGGNSVLFEETSRGKFILVKPIRYGLDSNEVT